MTEQQVSCNLNVFRCASQKKKKKIFFVNCVLHVKGVGFIYSRLHVDLHFTIGPELENYFSAVS